ncbi:cell division control protein 6 homolog [Brassica napus]|uniref:cell division control protein 6 homolog n=1 Tax=Brassica napus TaxID=3708 RepID=UPI002079DBF7|nr:cell division control protein 6 homolog [Brassica napus]
MERDITKATTLIASYLLSTYALTHRSPRFLSSSVLLKVESISCIRRHEKGSICLPECLRNLRNRIKGSTDQEPQSPVAEDQVVKKMNHMVTSLANTFKSPLVDTIQSILQHQQIVVCSAAKAFRESKKDISIALLPRIIFIE